MSNVVETIPDALAAEAEAARTWFSKEHGSEFKLTGIVDPDDVGQRVSATAKRELQLILCGSQDGQEVCRREHFELRPSSDGFDVVHLEQSAPDPGSPAQMLDPPAGSRNRWLDTVAANHSFIVLVFYRGFWCPPCRGELLGYQKEGIVDAIRQAGGEIYAVTSEPHSLALNAQQEWETGFDHVGDPHHEILAECNERGWLSLFIWQHLPNFRPEISRSLSHPKGVFQPGVLAFTREGRVLYRWRSRPNSQDVGGAICRVTAAHVWDSLQAELAKPSGAPDAPLDDAAKLDSGSVPQFLFLTFLFASGWFLKPNFFIMEARNYPLKKIAKQLRTAKLRVVIFAAGWIAAFAFLPTWIPALTLVGWIAIIAPQIYTLNKVGQQNVKFGEERDGAINGVTENGN